MNLLDRGQSWLMHKYASSFLTLISHQGCHLNCTANGNVSGYFCENNSGATPSPDRKMKQLFWKCIVGHLKSGPFILIRSCLQDSIEYLCRLSVAIKSKWHPQAMITAENYLDKLKVSKN